MIELNWWREPYADPKTGGRLEIMTISVTIDGTRFQVRRPTREAIDLMRKLSTAAAEVAEIAARGSSGHVNFND